MNILRTENVKLFIDDEKKLEFLSIRPKNDFDKWIIELSSQKGCQKRCRICDIWKCGFLGNAGAEDLKYQLSTIFNEEANLKEVSCLEIVFNRNGEPSYNPAIISFIKNELCDFVKEYVNATIINPVIYTMMPNDNSNLERFIRDFVQIKNDVYDGHADLILSVNTTDDIDRNKQRAGYASSLFQMSRMLQSLPDPEGEKYILSFAITKNTLIDVNLLTRLFNNHKWKVQLSLLHETETAKQNGLYKEATEEDMKRIAYDLAEKGWVVETLVPKYVEWDIGPGKNRIN